jgi:hypothetical protein
MNLLFVVVPLDEAVALGASCLAVATLPLELEEIDLLEELLLVELEFPRHLSIHAASKAKAASRPLPADKILPK